MTHMTTGRRIRTFLATAIVAVLALSLGASTALGSHALSFERYAPLDAAYTALIPLDRESVLASEVRAAQRACERLDRADALLGPFRGRCLWIVRIARLDGIGRCRSAAGCIRASARLRVAITRYLARARSADRAIDAVVLDPACRRALRTSPQELRGAAQLRSVLRATERALRTGSREGLRRADRRLGAIDFGPALKQQRTRFRGNCG